MAAVPTDGMIIPVAEGCTSSTILGTSTEHRHQETHISKGTEVWTMCVGKRHEWIYRVIS